MFSIIDLIVAAKPRIDFHFRELYCRQCPYYAQIFTIICTYPLKNVFFIKIKEYFTVIVEFISYVF